MDTFIAATQERMRRWQEAEGITVEPVVLHRAPISSAHAPGERPSLADAAPPAEAPRAAGRVTDAEALLALARDALATEQATHPSMACRRRPQLTAQVDPLSGWGRLDDGELLPPGNLKQVMKSPPGAAGCCGCGS